jgi:molybdopterin molybdotransferase
LIGIDGYKVVPKINGKLTRRAPSKLGLRHYVRGKIIHSGEEVLIEPTITSGAGILTSLSLSDGYIVINEDIEGYEEGDIVDIQLYRRYVK